jgi:hypothetical protein
LAHKRPKIKTTTNGHTNKDYRNLSIFIHLTLIIYTPSPLIHRMYGSFAPIHSVDKVMLMAG